ncbi:IS630 family transposase, partial [Roseomonas eburnea]|nr:IS630 family transposase [Neoroseomonas eburnea]
MPDRAGALRRDLWRDRDGPADARPRPVLADTTAAARRDGPGRPGGIQKKGFAAALAQIAADHPEAERIEVWFQDEARVGQKGRMVRRWFQRGMRPRMVKDQRYRSAYIFGAVCPARDTGAALVLTHVSVTAMNLLIEEVASQLPAGTHAAMLIDNAGWHTANDLRVPPNITLVHLPPYSPELNAIEKVWQYLRDRYLSGRL